MAEAMIRSLDLHVALRAGIAAFLGALIIVAFIMSAAAHDIYSSWRQPATGMSCCSEKDCRPLEDNQAKFENGHWLAWHKETGTWLVVPSAVIIREPNPTGKAHLCASETGRVWCFLPPDGGA